jgi:hypothetical protein
MREITLELVFRDGSTPVVKEARAQKFEVIQGEDVRVNFKSYQEDGAPKDLTGITLALGISRDPGGDAQIYGYPVLADVDSAADGDAHALIYDGDLAGYKPATFFVSVYAYEGSTDWQPLPQSKMKLLPSSAKPSNVLFPRGPAMQLIGVPAVAEGDVDAVFTLSDIDPRTFVWKRRKRGVLTFTEASGLDYQDVDLTALGLSAGGYSINLTTYNAEAESGVGARAVPRDGDAAYPAGPAATGFRVKLDAAADCKVIYIVEAL